MPSPLDALQALPARGAHFLLCRENKKPYTSAALGATRGICSSSVTGVLTATPWAQCPGVAGAPGKAHAHWRGEQDQ